MTQQSEAAMPADPMLVAAYLIDGYGPQQAGEIAALETEIRAVIADLAVDNGCTFAEMEAWLDANGHLGHLGSGGDA